jgi:hypothetical protein
LQLVVLQHPSVSNEVQVDEATAVTVIVLASPVPEYVLLQNSNNPVFAVDIKLSVKPTEVPV